MAIRGIFFDLGRVLVHWEWAEALAALAAKSPFSPEEIRAQLLSDGHLVRYELGAIDCAAFFGHQRERLQFAGTAEELQAIWTSIFSPLEANVALARRLAPHYRIGIISNTNHAHITFIERAYDFFDLFPVKIYSHKVKALKPGREIYDIAAAAHGLKPEECLLLDDLPANLEGAALLGWETILVTPGLDLNAALAARGIAGATI